MEYTYRKTREGKTEISLIEVFDFLKNIPPPLEEADALDFVLELDEPEVTESCNPDIEAYCNLLYYFDAGENAQALDFMGVKVYNHNSLLLPEGFSIEAWEAVLIQINIWLDENIEEDQDSGTLAGRYWNQLIQQGGDDTVYDYFNSHVTIFLDVLKAYMAVAKLEEA